MALHTVHLLRRPSTDGPEYEVVIHPLGFDDELRAFNLFPSVNVTIERGDRLVLTLSVDGVDQDALVRQLLGRLGIDDVRITAARAVCSICRDGTPVAQTHLGAACEECLSSLRWHADPGSAADLEVA